MEGAEGSSCQTSRLETLMTWRGSAKRSGTKSLSEMCANLKTNYKKRQTSVIAKGFATKY